MSIIVLNGKFCSPDESEKSGLDSFVDIPTDADPVELRDKFAEVSGFRIIVESPSDGRVFSLARALRDSGFAGRLRAYGPLIADQYPLALRCGLDDIQIDDDLASRQGEEQWSDAYGRIEHTYRESLMSANSDNSTSKEE